MFFMGYLMQAKLPDDAWEVMSYHFVSLYLRF